MLSEIFVFFILAAFIIYRLYISLGRDDSIDINSLINKENNTNNRHKPIVETDFKTIDTFDHVNSECLNKVKKIVENIKDEDNKFSLDRFMKKAELAFEYIMNDFYKGCIEDIKNILSKDIYIYFNNQIKKRNNKYKYNYNLISIKKCEMIDAVLENNEVIFKVVFISEQINFITDENNDIISGSNNKSIDVEDTWSFMRNIKDNNLVWILKDVRS